MNFPNKLTMARILLIPVFVLFFYLEGIMPLWNIAAMVVFIIAGITDIWDGHYARKHNLVTDFGKLMDPMADKLLTNTAFILLTSRGDLPALITVAFISRDFIISAFRLIALEKHVVIAAEKIGKYKTLAQDIAVCLLLHGISVPVLRIAGNVVAYIALVLTIWSLIAYLIKNKGVVSTK